MEEWIEDTSMRRKDYEKSLWTARATMLYRDVLAANPRLLHQVSAVLFAHDPVFIKHGNNTDEYDPEAGTIIARLGECATLAEAQVVVCEEFSMWFDEDTAGPIERYAEIAREIWHLWLADSR